MKSSVYFVRPIGGGPIKIGHTANPHTRLSTMLQWSPAPLELVAQFEGGALQEAYLHAKFAPHRMHSEWFRPDYPVVEAVHLITTTGTYPGLPALFEHRNPERARLENIMREVRKEKLGLTQTEFAQAIGASIVSIKNWDVGCISEAIIGRVIYFASTRGIHLDPSDFVRERAAKAA